VAPKKGKVKTAILVIKQVRSGIGCSPKQRLVLRGLGFRKLNQVVLRPDTPEIRGMIAKIPHLVKVIEGEKKVRKKSPIKRKQHG